MTAREFCYWLQGYFELSSSNALSPEQTKAIKAHLAMVFHHEIDPSYPDGEKLNELHSQGAVPADAPLHSHAPQGAWHPHSTLIRC